MDLKQIEELIKMVDTSSLTTFELEEEGLKIVLKKEKEKIITKEMQTAPLALNPVPTANSTETTGAATVAPQKPETDQPTITSPIVGTYYASSSPGAQPFVNVGSIVKKGDTLCIIEAMKLMNEIEAEEDVQIIDILVKDGQMVEYGQPLFIVSPNTR